MIIIDWPCRCRHKFVTVCRNVNFFSQNTLMLGAVVNFHRVTSSTSSGIDIKYGKRIETVNASYSVVVGSGIFTVRDRTINQWSGCGIRGSSWISLKTSFFFEITPWVFIIQKGFGGWGYTFSIVYVILIWTADTNDTVIERFLGRTVFVWF